MIDLLPVEVPWSTYVPGLETNYTDFDDARRRCNRDIIHTGKNDISKIGRYIKYQNMTEVDSPHAPFHIRSRTERHHCGFRSLLSLLLHATQMYFCPAAPAGSGDDQTSTPGDASYNTSAVTLTSKHTSPP